MPPTSWAMIAIRSPRRDDADRHHDPKLATLLPQLARIDHLRATLHDAAQALFDQVNADQDLLSQYLSGRPAIRSDDDPPDEAA
jgi:hypothetical protein